MFILMLSENILRIVSDFFSMLPKNDIIMDVKYVCIFRVYYSFVYSILH
jgi:hypothetical protein